METRPRSVLAAFQEHLQIASTKCGSLMEQLNIVRKKVEGKDATTMNGLDPVSDDFFKNVSPKTVVKSEEMDLMGHKGVLKEQMAVGNAYVERSTGDMNCDVNTHLKRTSSQIYKIIGNKQEVPFLNGNVTSNEKESYSLQFDGATNHKRSKEKLIEESEKISGKASPKSVKGSDKEKKSLNRALSSDGETTTLSSCSSSDDDDDVGPSGKENIYQELLKRLKDNEEKKQQIKNSRSSSENSSSSFNKSLKAGSTSPKKNSSNSTINDDQFDKKNPGDIENLDVGVDFFLPSSVTEKFQEMFYEDSCEEETMELKNNNNKDKNLRVTFDDLIIGRPKKHSFGGEIHVENFSPPKETSPKSKVGTNKTKQHTQNGKVKEIDCDTSSVRTKSEKGKKQNTTICSSTIMNFKLNSPEMNLYKRLNGVPLRRETKKTAGRKDAKTKKSTIVNSKMKSKHTTGEAKSKTLTDKKSIAPINDSKNTKNENELTETINKIDKDGGIDTIFKNKTQQKNNSVAVSKNSDKKHGFEILTKPNKIETKLSNDSGVKILSSDELLNNKEDVKRDTFISQESKNVLKNIRVYKMGNLQNLKEKRNQDVKNTILNKNHASIKSNYQDIPEEKPVQPVKNTLVKETKPVVTKIELNNNNRKNNMRTLTTGKEVSPKHKCINEESPPILKKMKSNVDSVRRNTSITQIKKESNKVKAPSSRKEAFDMRNLKKIEKNSKNKETYENSKGRQAKETMHSQSLNDMKTHITSFPFILGQSTSKTYNVRAAIQQTMSMIMRSPAETLRRSSFSEVLNVSSKSSTLKTSASSTSGRKVCPACVMRVVEEDNEPDDRPVDPWDTEYHSKRFVRCTCMPRNTVNFKTVMNQLLNETSSSSILPAESYQETELENGQENRVNKSLFRKNNNIYKLSKLLHTLLKIRDLLVT